jgi:hypothetical protein
MSNGREWMGFSACRCAAGSPQKDCDSPAVGKWAAVPCGCSRVQSPLPSIVHRWSAAYVWSFCTPVSAWLFSAYHSPWLLVRICTLVAPAFAVTRHSWSSLSSVVVLLSPSMSSPCDVLCQCCCRPPRSPLSLAQLRGSVVPSWPSTASLL